MADEEIDDLLAEVGAAVDGGAATSVSASATVAAQKTVAHEMSSSKTSDPLDELLAMTADTAVLSNARQREHLSGSVAPRSSRGAAVSHSSQAQRCDPVYVGEGSDRPGRAPCPSMRCIACDFPVLSFPRAAWPKDVGYMFFRNHCPDRAKLSAGMLSEQGAVAYCCQCSWLSLHAGEGLHAVRRGAVPVPPSSAEWAGGVASGRVVVGGGGWASWTCSGGHS